MTAAPLAQVTLSVWHVAIMVVFAAGSLIVSLYCLFFMVPMKRFWERIHSLGGGIKGIEKHVSGVREEIHKRLKELEGESRRERHEIAEQSRQEAEELKKANREARRKVEKLQGELQSLQSELRQAVEENKRLSHLVEVVSNRLQQVRGDVEGLGVELRESVRQQVADSFTTVESTILSALEAIQEEMLYGTVETKDPREPFPARHQPRHRHSPDDGAAGERQNIISMGPLFAGSHAESEQETQEDDAAEKSDEPDSSDAEPQKAQPAEEDE